MKKRSAMLDGKLPFYIKPPVGVGAYRQRTMIILGSLESA